MKHLSSILTMVNLITGMMTNILKTVSDRSK